MTAILSRGENFVQKLRLIQLPLIPVQIAKFMHRLQCLQMFPTQKLSVHSESTFKQWPCLLVLPAVRVDLAKRIHQSSLYKGFVL